MGVLSSRYRLVTTLGCAVAVAACGSRSGDRRVATACGSAKVGVKAKLVLSNVSPPPRMHLSSGDAVQVLSSYHGNKMTFPTAHPVSAVCEVSQRRDSSGNATVVYELRRPATIRFFSTYTQATNAAMPAMLGKIVVSH
jgi:hypothetical protein